MLVFHAAPRQPVLKKLTTDEQEILDRLNSYLDEKAPELVRLLCSVLDDQQAAITYRELRELAMNGGDAQILQWQDDYAKMVNERLRPIWLAAMKAGAAKFEAELGGKLLDDSDVEVQRWLDNHGAEFVTNISNETRQAVKSILWKCQSKNRTARDIAYYIRPCIGQTKRDALANARYQQKVYDSIKKSHPRMAEENVARRAQEAALKYAGLQHRRRADMIANTELAFAYNRGAHESVRQAVKKGLMGPVEKVWTTAGSERVCSHCAALNGKRVGFDDSFGIPGRELFVGMHEMPPAHPHCRCAIQYREIAPPANRELAARDANVTTPPDHPQAQQLGKIDFSNEAVVKSTIEYFEPQIAKQPVENAIVITQAGEVYRCFGDLDGVYPHTDLGEKLRGAVVTHNHPINSANEYSFSNEDINLFCDYNLKILRGIDEQYVYELRKYNRAIQESEIDKEMTIEELIQNANSSRHNDVIRKIRSLGTVGYRRWRRD